MPKPVNNTLFHNKHVKLNLQISRSWLNKTKSHREDRLRPFTDYRKRGYSSHKLSRSVSAPDYDQCEPVSLQKELEQIYTSFASSSFSPMSSFDSEGSSADTVFFNHTSSPPDSHHQPPPPRQPLARKASAPAAVSCDLFRKKRRLFARGRSSNPTSRKEYSPVDENPEHTFCQSPQSEGSSREERSDRSGSYTAQRKPSIKPKLKLASRQLSVDYGDGVDDEFAHPPEYSGNIHSGIMENSPFSRN